jgi:hypothetical protein
MTTLRVELRWTITRLDTEEAAPDTSFPRPSRLD